MTMRRILFSLAVLLASLPVAADAQGLGPEFRKLEQPRFTLDLSFFEIDPKDPLAGYTPVGHEGGLAGNGESTDMLSARDGDLQVRVIRRATRDRFPVVVEVARVGAPAGTPPQRHELDLTDLAPRQVDLGPGRHGRTLKLNLMPRVGTERPEPRDLRPQDVLYTWDFSGAVLWNQEYRGSYGDHGGPIAYLVFPDLGSFSFALLPFDGASATGEYDPETRTVVIRSGDDVLMVHGARVGTPPLALAGGPYRVWVRREPVDPRTEEMVRTTRERLKQNPQRFTAEQRKRILAQLDRGQVIGHGTRSGRFVWRHGRLELSDRQASTGTR